MLKPQTHKEKYGGRVWGLGEAFMPAATAAMRTQLSPEMLHTRKIRRRKTGFQRMGRRFRNSDGCRGSAATQLLAATIPLRKVCQSAGSGCRKQSFAALFDWPRSPSRSPPDPPQL